jgi:hypothetical protein
MDDPAPQLTDLEALRAALCFKDHELFMLRTQLERMEQENHLLILSIERLEKTTAACFDRIVRKVDRLTNSGETEARKRRRHY